MGKPGELASEVGTAKYFGIGAILMALVGTAIVAYSLVTGETSRGNDEAQAIVVIAIAAVGFVVMGIAVAATLYRRRSK